MSNFIVKPGQQKEEFHRTKKWEKGARIGKRRLEKGQFKFENEAQKRDYDRAVSANPNNAPGMPVFFPPLLLWGTGIGEGQPCELLPCGHPWRTKKYDVKGQCTVACKYGHQYPEGETR